MVSSPHRCARFRTSSHVYALFPTATQLLRVHAVRRCVTLFDAASPSPTALVPVAGTPRAANPGIAIPGLESVPLTTPTSIFGASLGRVGVRWGSESLPTVFAVYRSKPRRYGAFGLYIAKRANRRMGS